MKTDLERNREIIINYQFHIPETYCTTEPLPNLVSRHFHGGCEKIRRGRIEEGMDELLKMGQRYYPLTTYVFAQLVAYFTKDWNRVMNLLVFAFGDSRYYHLMKSIWEREHEFDWLLVSVAATKTKRTDEAKKILAYLESMNRTKVKKNKITTADHYLALRKSMYDIEMRLWRAYDECKTEVYYQQDYCDMAYSFIKIGEKEKAAEMFLKWTDWFVGAINYKTLNVIPFDAFVANEFYEIGDDAYMNLHWELFKHSRFVKIEEDGPLDTRLATPKPCPQIRGFKIHGLLESAFNKPRCVCKGWVFEKLLLGKIKIFSGKIAVGDPLYVSCNELYPQFPKGSFPVELALAKQFGDTRVALAQIRFSNKEIATWDIAMTDDSKPRPSYLYGYSVDMGAGFFADVETFWAYQREASHNVTSGIQRALETSGNTGIIHRNMAVFSTGFGEGFYESYIGKDKNNNIVCLITDFQIVKWRRA
ncbi:DUF4241 domain-containing protein [Bacteroides sp. 519]|uniref:DUF4241 domain-containing protein n=1 Tax=Bacteroides sp. 519 TaxID=2302937 RepID=UPI0013D5DF53|nr:DUF4241 domain-containing protein [Bacteroides sp. 519]NDV58915.1 DUF4241 domain-containing protein [Bacteroides sp. 519]